MAKTTYRSLVTIPGAETDPIVDENDVVGGDIVKNFKAIADIIHPDGNGIAVGGSNHTVSSTGTHIVNNSVIGNISVNSAFYQSDGAGSVVYGGNSGAFVKGVMIPGPDSSVGTYKLMDVPYGSCMIVNYQVIAVSGSGTTYTFTGNFSIFPGYYGELTSSGGTEGLPLIGYFNVSNGDLEFTTTNFAKSSSIITMQIGLFGTMCSGYSDLNTGQSESGILSSYSYSEDYTG